MPGHGEKLSRKQEQCIVALLCEPTLERAAAAAGVSLRSLKTWLRDPGFQQEYRTARRQLVEGALGRLQQATGEAVDTLRRLLTCGRPAVEARAAVAVLEQSVKAVELIDLAERVEALEQAAKEKP
jgi:hypothetical protein